MEPASDSNGCPADDDERPHSVACRTLRQQWCSHCGCGGCPATPKTARHPRFRSILWLVIGFQTADFYIECIRMSSYVKLFDTALSSLARRLFYTGMHRNRLAVGLCAPARLSSWFRRVCSRKGKGGKEERKERREGRWTPNFWNMATPLCDTTALVAAFKHIAITTR